MGAYLEIRHAEGASERHALDRDQLIVGRQPQNGVAIPHARTLENEHLLFSPRREGCWVDVVQGSRMPAAVGGRRFDGGMVAWGTEISLGPLSFKVMNAPPAEERRAPSVSPTTLLLSVGLLGAAAWLFLPSDNDGLPEMTAADPPSLFAELPGCPETDATAALARAKEAAEAAAAKSDRYPFAAQDGVKAVELYVLAEDCFDVAGRGGDIEGLQRQRGALQSRIEEDYKTHRLKLKRALRYQRTREALVETQELLALANHIDGPYTKWLRTMERHLLLRVK